MSPTSRTDKVRLAALAIGVALLAGTLYYTDLETSIQTVGRLGIALPLAVLFSGLWHLARTWAWAWCFPDRRAVPFLRLARVRLAAEAFSYLTLRGIAGEPLKVLLLTDRLDPRVSTAAVALERVAFMIVTALIVGAGSLVAILVLPLTEVWFRIFRAFVIASAAIALLTWIVLSGRGTYVLALLGSWDARFGTHLGTSRVGGFLAAVERQMLDLVRGSRARLLVLLVTTVASYVLMALEAWVILASAGTRVSALDAVTIETFSRVASFASALIPANLGALEASSVAAAAAVGAGGGVALALVRRLRGLFWAAVGLAIYPRALGKAAAPQASDHSAASRSDGPVLLYPVRDPAVEMSPHTRLAGMPLSERVIRSALRAGYGRVILHTEAEEDGAWIERTTREFREKVTVTRTAAEWRAALAPFAETDPLTAIGAGTLASPELLRDALSFQAERGGAKDVPAGEPWPASGVIRTTAGDARELPALAEALRGRLGIVDGPSGEDVSCGHGRLAIRMVHPSDIPAAERTLRRSVYKHTDGPTARFNRRISLPLSVALIRTPLTANQLSVLLVALGFYAAWLFSLGSYWPGVAAACLSLVASVLDGCDGEIARLKYQESALGCWIETLGDYSYYVAIFIGLTVGAVRQTGAEAFYWVGAAAMGGTLVTLALLIYLRARITNGDPKRLHAIARARFHAQPALWSRVAWQLSAICTRATMPYAILLLAIAKALPLALVLIAIGANLYWVSLVLKLRDLLGDDETVTA